MSVGGYQIIDFKNFPFIGDNTDVLTIEGISKKITGTKKPILITNLCVSNTKAQSFYSYPLIDGGSIIITTPKINHHAYTITINSDDTIKVMYIQTT